jgi:hypothetical protein
VNAVENQHVGTIFAGIGSHKATRMNHQLSDLDLETLKSMYEKEQAELTSKLLSGALWNEVKDQREKLTGIAIVLHRKAREMGLNPAEITGGESERKKTMQEITDGKFAPPANPSGAHQKQQ